MNLATQFKPVVAIDIDGTIGEYHDHFIAFAEGWGGKPIPRKYDGSVPFNKWCGMSKPNYRKCKLAYRRGGLKRSMPSYPGARELSVTVRKKGALLVVCTTRPFLALDAVDEDTRVCLRRWGFQYDDIIHGEHKYRDLVKSYGAHRVVMVLDDLPEMLEQAASLGLPAVLRENGHNSNVEWSPRVHNLFAAEMLALHRIETYLGRHRRGD
jgi:phosphoglycolate phosphatase-like HAD superfamily hydrolase